MAFWSSQTLKSRVPSLVHPFEEKAIDCNAYTLRVGPEIYITPSLEVGSPGSHTKQQLAEDEAFAIPPGQFAFLLTEEHVKVPPEAMAFISIKARTKFRGLVNVSGFHVDPGWSGPLIFAVFNCGPSAVHLERGMPLFLIWYADLDAASEKRKHGEGPKLIPPHMINNITGELDSFYSLDKRMREEDKKLSDSIHVIEKTQIRILVTFSVIGAILIGSIGFALRSAISDWLHQNQQVQSAPAIQTPPPTP